MEYQISSMKMTMETESLIKVTSLNRLENTSDFKLLLNAFILDEVDTDGDGIPDILDEDDDNNGIPDVGELLNYFNEPIEVSTC